MTKLVKVSDELANELEGLTRDQIVATLVESAYNFTDITSVDTPQGTKVFLHSLTGKKLQITGFFEE